VRFEGDSVGNQAFGSFRDITVGLFFDAAMDASGRSTNEYAARGVGGFAQGQIVAENEVTTSTSLTSGASGTIVELPVTVLFPMGLEVEFYAPRVQVAAGGAVFISLEDTTKKKTTTLAEVRSTAGATAPCFFKTRLTASAGTTLKVVATASDGAATIDGSLSAITLRVKRAA
jgi:hypothetical protein